jgi:hypothetical protein
VLEDDGLFGDLTVYNPNADGPACCRVVSFPNTGSALPVAYRSLRSYLELKWVFGELQKRREALKHATSDPQ